MEKGFCSPYTLHVPGAAHAGHFSPERLCDLHGEGIHTSGRTVDQDFLSRFQQSRLQYKGKDG